MYKLTEAELCHAPTTDTYTKACSDWYESKKICLIIRFRVLILHRKRINRYRIAFIHFSVHVIPAFLYQLVQSGNSPTKTHYSYIVSHSNETGRNRREIHCVP